MQFMHLIILILVYLVRSGVLCSIGVMDYFASFGIMNV